MAKILFLCKTGQEKAQVAQSMVQPQYKDIDVLYVKIGHPSEAIIQATGRVMGLYLRGTFKPCEEHTLDNAKKQARLELQDFGRFFKYQLTFDSNL